MSMPFPRSRTPAARRRLPIGLLLAALIAGCSSSIAPPTPLRIGIVLDQDGVQGARLAAAEAARLLAPAGVALELRIVSPPDAVTAESSMRIATGLASEAEVVAVIGHANSAASLSASQIYNDRRLPQIAPASTAPMFSSAGPYSFRLVPDDGYQARFLAEQLAAAGAQRIAIVYENDDYGRALHSILREVLSERRAQVVYERPFVSPAVRRLASAAEAIRHAAPDHLVWIGKSSDLIPLLTDLRRGLPTLPVLGSDRVDLPTMSRAGFSGVRASRFVEPDGGGPRFQAFRAEFRALTNREVSTDAALTYEAVMLIAQAIRDGARTREAIRDYLASVGTTRAPYEGIVGPIAFDSAGDVARPLRLAEARAGAMQPAPAR